MRDVTDAEWVALSPEIRLLRWCRLNGGQTRHLWIGSLGTACGKCGPEATNYSVDVYDGGCTASCSVCVGYAVGWINRDLSGPTPSRLDPNPLAGGGRAAINKVRAESLAVTA